MNNTYNVVEMDYDPNKKLFLKLEAKGFEPKHVAEVGVYTPETSNIFDYIERGIKTSLVEPDPASIERIRKKFGHCDHVTLHTVAAYDFNGPLNLVKRDASTFVSELESSPAIENDGYEVTDEDEFSVDSVTFDRIDDGTIDLLSIDTEGSEWFVLKYMTSRPAVISIETHGAIYINPHIDKICEWMRDNNYRVLFKDKTDSVYVQESAVRVSIVDKLRLAVRNFLIRLRRARKKAFSRQ